jgi:peroxiredoxin Q/BCP
MLSEQTKAPNFSAQDQFGNIHSLSDYKGKWLVLYFYPKDNTPGCTKEACAIRDAWSDFRDRDITVLGVSADSVKSHASFAEKYSLPFLLLSDPEKKILNAYKAIGMKKMYGREYEGILRITYVISPKGIIVKAYPKVKPEEHAQQIIEDLPA